MRLFLILFLFVVLLPACSEEAGAPEKPECDLSISSLYFGQILRPVVENETEVVARTINVLSIVQVRSNAGNEDLIAQAQLIPNDTGSDAVSARIVETNLIDGFQVPPDGVVTVTVELTLRVDSRIGRHEGKVLFGDACGEATYAIDVIGWDEEPPLLDSFWGGEGTADGQFNLPSSIALNSKGEIFVVDRGNDRVQKFDADGQHMATWKGYNPEGKFFIPTGIGIDSQDNVFVTDCGGGGKRVQMFDKDG
ncbi:MAG: hypothetical protein HKN21_17190, partial [Candidatus Eisenbacteria bacterium]|nr:hypothetical protein [Candidatus Eisenbacteria bacterium]